MQRGFESAARGLHIARALQAKARTGAEQHQSGDQSKAAGQSLSFDY
ncbi:MAG: hypothetical protein QF497_09770 [Verrucomicrobiota bacterium]|nr:hypothetical protein [Verrucomicrobiota bacterium]